MADNLFNQADLNKDQRLDLHEFRTFLIQNLGASGSGYAGNLGDANQYSVGAYGNIDDNNSAYGGITSVTATSSNGISNVGSVGNYGSYEQTSFSSAVNGAANVSNANATSNVDVTATTAVAGGSSSSSSFETNNAEQQIQQYATDSQGLYQDPNPQIIRRPAQGGQLTYTQNVKIRFLQPPPIPPPGPLIIKEVRPPQPPPPPPLVVRQRAPPLPTPPPLILRERPPPIPAAVPSQTVIRNLPPVPIPPRSVIIERLPPLPPKPRDIIIERWIPYGAMTKRKTIVQRAEAAKPYPKPRNIIIQYEAPQVRVVRQFQRLGVTPENPQEYVQRYGSSLFDSQTLLQQARAAGVTEDISPPSNINIATGSISSFNVDATNGTTATETNAVGGSSSSFESSNFAVQQGASGFSGFESTQGTSGGDMATSFESSSFSSQGGGPAFSGITTSGYQTYNPSSNVIDIANAAFDVADLNKDGTIDPNEFRQFISSRLQ